MRVFLEHNKFAARMLAVLLCLVMLCTGCTGKTDSNQDVSQDNASSASYSSITMADAAALLESENDYIVLDVRTEQEYFSGHIPGALCIPNESIDETISEVLPDKEQTIFVYCRSGNRSKEASEKLVNLGYTSVVEIGGVKDWPGELIVISEE